MNADEGDLLAELNAAGDDDRCCPALRRAPGELLARGDVCHVHADRAAAERCGVLLGGAPELVPAR